MYKCLWSSLGFLRPSFSSPTLWISKTLQASFHVPRTSECSCRKQIDSVKCQSFRSEAGNISSPNQSPYIYVKCKVWEFYISSKLTRKQLWVYFSKEFQLTANVHGICWLFCKSRTQVLKNVKNKRFDDCNIRKKEKKTRTPKKQLPQQNVLNKEHLVQ